MVSVRVHDHLTLSRFSEPLTLYNGPVIIYDRGGGWKKLTLIFMRKFFNAHSACRQNISRPTRHRAKGAVIIYGRGGGAGANPKIACVTMLPLKGQHRTPPISTHQNIFGRSAPTFSSAPPAINNDQSLKLDHPEGSNVSKCV